MATQENVQDSDTKRKPKTLKNFRLSDDGEAYLLALTEHLGLKQTGVVELALRKLAQAEGVTLPRKGMSTDGERD